MNLKPALKLSIEVANAERELRRCETVDELQDAWFIHCDNFNGKRREYLQSVYDEMLRVIRTRDAMADDLIAYARTL
jgi:hypothetical protein